MLIVVVATVALGAGSTQIGIAEFAPSARQSIDAPSTTGADTPGQGGRNGGRRATTTTNAASTTPDATNDAGSPTSLVGRGRQCYGSPPRQIEDPMSPPCLATVFEGDNGGATTPGVNGTSIRVAIPGNASTLAAEEKSLRAMFEFFNRHFEFYGRRLEPVLVPSSTFDQTPQMNRALAAELASQNLFAVLPGTLERNGLAHLTLYRELARRGIITLPSNMSYWLSDALVYDELHPYVWSPFPSAEQIWRNYVDFSCSTLVGKAARLANDANLRQTTRKFGILASTFWTTPSTALPKAGLEACGAEVVTASIPSRLGSSDQVRTVMQKFKDAGVTTVVCACPWDGSWQMVDPAKSVGFGPEWITLTSDHTNSLGDLSSLHYVGQPGSFSVSYREKILPYQARPWFQALMETAPDFATDSLTSATNGSELLAAVAVGVRTYPSLLILASGIQAAGPNLSPQTFGAGLMSTQFANTGAGQAPYYQPSVGFAPGDHTLIDDFSISWWDPTLPGIEVQQGIPGSLCYADRGARFRVGSWPADLEGRIVDRSKPCQR